MAAIPRKRAQPPETISLERDEVQGTLGALPVDGRRALRDRVLLLFLYNTGARVQEVADVCTSDIHFDPTPRVHLHGKGDKWRVCPLWAETSDLLKKLLSEHGPGSPPDRPIFTGARDAALTRFGIYKIIRRYTTQVVKNGIGWPVKTGLTARVATHHRCASSGSRGRSKRHSRLAGPCKSPVSAGCISAGAASKMSCCVRSTKLERSCSLIGPAIPFRLTTLAAAQCSRRIYSWQCWEPVRNLCRGDAGRAVGELDRRTRAGV